MRIMLGLALLAIFGIGAFALARGPATAPLLAPSALMARIDGSLFRLEALTPMMHPGEYRVEYARDALRRAATGPASGARNQVDAAIDALQGAVRRRPNDARAWAMLGGAQILVGQRAAALEAHRRSATAAPDAPQIAATRLRVASDLRSSLAMADIEQAERDLATVAAWNRETHQGLIKGSRYLRLVDARRPRAPAAARQ